MSSQEERKATLSQEENVLNWKYDVSMKQNYGERIHKFPIKKNLIFM